MTPISTPPFNFYAVSDRLYGLARPAYKKTRFLEKEPPMQETFWTSIDNIIVQNLSFLHSQGIKQLVSLSNAFYHKCMDTRIQKIWEETFGGRFHHIPTEDHMTSSYEEELAPGQGITVDKLRQFHAIISASTDRTAVYCGAGQGRTGAYLLSLHVAEKWFSSGDAAPDIDALMETSLKTIASLVGTHPDVIKEFCMDVERSDVMEYIPEYLKTLQEASFPPSRK